MFTAEQYAIQHAQYCGIPTPTSSQKKNADANKRDVRIFFTKIIAFIKCNVLNHNYNYLQMWQCHKCGWISNIKENVMGHMVACEKNRLKKKPRFLCPHNCKDVPREFAERELLKEHLQAEVFIFLLNI